MSELLDKQLWLPMNKGFTTKVGGNQKYVMKIKKKTTACQKNFNGGNDFFKMLHNSRSTDEDETDNNESTCNKGTTCGITNV